MNFFDIIFTIILIVVLILGLRNGVLKEFLSLLGAVAGYMAAEKYHVSLTNYVSPYINNPGYAKLTTYLTLFITGLVLGYLLSRLSNVLSSANKPVLLSRIVGVGFGVIKGLLIIFVILYIVRNNFNVNLGDDLSRSFFNIPILKIKNIVHAILFF